MELEEAIDKLNDFKTIKILYGDTFAMHIEQLKKVQEAIETALKALENKDKEITDMREMIVRVAKSLEKKGKYELSEYILAQIEATPTFTTWEEYTTWVSKKKIEDKIKRLEEVQKEFPSNAGIRVQIITLKELLKED